MTEAQPKQRFQTGNVLRGFIGALFLSALTLLVEFWISPSENPLLLLSRYAGYAALLVLGLLGLSRQRLKSYALGAVLFCLLLVVPVLFLVVNLIRDGQAMRPL